MTDKTELKPCPLCESLAARVEKLQMALEQAAFDFSFAHKEITAGCYDSALVSTGVGEARSRRALADDPRGGANT